MNGQWMALKPADPAYAPLLAEIHDPPVPLFVRGTLDLQGKFVLAVVGSRRATPYGRAAVERIITPLAAAGVVIVSGLAHGIDGAAHTAALKGGGVTIAVLGTPIDTIYPVGHTGLAEKIMASGGAICSELPSGGDVHRGSFPRRNRIIAGLAQATLVVEAALDSGSLITAQLALEENREVLAVPGPITSPTSAGTNNLLKLGARPVTDANDILALFSLPFARDTNQVKPAGVIEPADQSILMLLEAGEPVHIDKLARSATIDLPALQGRMTVLELRGLVKMVQPGWYIRL